MKPRVYYHPLDEHRQWVVQYINSTHYFPTYQAAMEYVKSLVPKKP